MNSKSREGAAQALGYALFEDFTVDNGKIITGDFSTYILPTSLDLPDMRLAAFESHESEGPYNMKGVGEIGINGAFPAVANALTTACVAPINDLRATAEYRRKAAGNLLLRLINGHV